MGRKRGRPKVADIDQATHRVHQIVLDQTAERIYRYVSNQRGRNNWIHEYFSSVIKRDFAETMEAVLVQEIQEEQRKRDAIEECMIQKAKKLAALKDKKVQSQTDRDIINILKSKQIEPERVKSPI
jgi:hypothetical protein